MSQTTERILDAAEVLFASRGIGATTLRAITERAGVNVAAVNYHFGSKQQLVHQVFRRRLDELNEERTRAFDALGSSPQAETILQAFIAPALQLSRSEGGTRFVKILAKAYAEEDAQLHAFMSAHYGHVMRRMAALLRQALPEISEDHLRTRIHFIVGSLTYAMADFGHHELPHPEHLATDLARFGAAGLRADQEGSRDDSPGDHRDTRPQAQAYG